MKRLFALLMALLLTAASAAVFPVSADEDDSDSDGSPEGSGSNSGKGKGNATDDEDHPGQGHGPPGDVDDETDGEDEDGDDDGPGGGDNRGPRRAGHFEESGGVFDGRFVDFRLDRDACTVEDYSVMGVPFFASIDLPGPCEAEDHSGEGQGARVELDGETGELRIHDNPTGLIRFEVEDGDASLVFELADGVFVGKNGSKVTLGAGNLTARLFLTGDDEGGLAFANGTITVTDAKGNFLVHPEDPGRAEDRRIDEAIHKRKVGGQVDVILENGSVVSEVLEFDDVIIKVSRKNDSAFRFLVDADLTEGRVFIVNFAPGVFHEGKVGVRFFDVENGTGLAEEVAIGQADSLAELLDIQAGEGPRFWIFSDEQGKHVAVAVPHFSVHVFEVLGIPPTVVPTILYGAVFGFLFVATGAVGMFMGRRRP